MDSNFQYAGAVNLIVAHLVLGLLLWVSPPDSLLERDGVELLVPCREKMNPVREPEPKPSRR
jgi:hypothetical protein